MDIDECTEVLDDLLLREERARPRVKIFWSARALLLADDLEDDEPFDEQSTQVWTDPREG